MARRLQKQTWVELAKRLAVLIGMGIATAQISAQTPPDQTRQIERDKEAMRRAARSGLVKFIGSPTLVRVQPIPMLWPSLKKIEK
jgi:hypothetical protein